MWFFFFFPCTACWDVCISAIHCVWPWSLCISPIPNTFSNFQSWAVEIYVFLHWQWERMLLCYVGKLWTLCVAGHGWQNCSISLIILLYQQVQHILIWRRKWKRIVIIVVSHWHKTFQEAMEICIFKSDKKIFHHLILITFANSSVFCQWHKYATHYQVCVAMDENWAEFLLCSTKWFFKIIICWIFPPKCIIVCLFVLFFPFSFSHTGRPEIVWGQKGEGPENFCNDFHLHQPP